MDGKHYKKLPNTFSGKPDYSLLPMHMWQPLERYYWDGTPPGGFLTSVLANELIQAACRADNLNAVMLSQIAKFVYWSLPVVCYGSPQAVASWVVKGGAHGGEPGVETPRAEDAGIEIAPKVDLD